MKVNLRKYTKDNLLNIEILGDTGKLKNIIIVAYSDNKKYILLKKVVFSDIDFLDRIDCNILDICEKIVQKYGDRSDLEKLWLASKIFKEISINREGE